MADKPKTVNKAASGLTRPGDVYVQGDELPVPEVEEKNTDSVWALWSDLVDENKPGRERDFLETVPLDRDALADTQLMGMPEVPKK